MASRSGYLCFCLPGCLRHIFPVIWADWDSHLPIRGWDWTGRNRRWFKICSLLFLNNCGPFSSKLNLASGWQMQSHSLSARAHQLCMCHLCSICRKWDVPIDFRRAGKGMQHHSNDTELFYSSHLSTIKFGNPTGLCFKTWPIYTISKCQLLSAGLLSLFKWKSSGNESFSLFKIIIAVI